MTMAVTYLRHTGESAADAILSPAYGDLYDDIHADPSYNANPLFARQRFIDRTVSQVRQPGFELVTAHDGGKLAGFCFGFTMEAGRWWGGETSPAPADVVDAPKVAVIELMVGDQHRGSGVGKRLLSELLGDRDRVSPRVAGSAVE
ncbi:GNAT family N-acetyltransferase [Nonomuraea sp. NPDC047897]|uniref:GNAT family N-acetyltransferase n=1 Tax=Nonomuraea sp. NPDC047897 TaxID=3364346 RepID=UPI00371C2125